MTPCPCGCGNLVPPGNRWAKRGCCLRGTVRTPEQREATRRAWIAKVGAAQAREAYAQAGAKGGRSTLIERWSALLERWQSMSPREALHEAYWRGYRSGYQTAKKTKGGGRLTEGEYYRRQRKQDARNAQVVLSQEDLCPQSNGS